MKTILSILALILVIIIVVLMIILKLLAKTEDSQKRTKKAKCIMIGITTCSVLTFIIQVITLFIS